MHHSGCTHGTEEKAPENNKVWQVINAQNLHNRDETTCSNPAQPDDQKTYLRAPAPDGLGPQYCPKSRVSINQKPHVFVVPCWLPRTLHMLQDALQEMVSEKFVEWAQSRVRDMIKLESPTMHIVKFINERGDLIIILRSCR